MIDPMVLRWMQEISPQVESLTVHFVGRESVAVIHGNTFRDLVRDVADVSNGRKMIHDDLRGGKMSPGKE